MARSKNSYVKELSKLRRASLGLLHEVDRLDQTDDSLTEAASKLRDIVDPEPPSVEHGLLFLAAVPPITRLGTSVHQILGKARTSEVARHRQMICYALRRGSKLSFPEIGVIMGLDQSTVQHAVRKVEARKKAALLSPAEFDALVKAIEAVRFAGMPAKEKR